MLFAEVKRIVSKGVFLGKRKETRERNIYYNIRTSQTSMARSGCQRNGFMRLLWIY